MKEMRFSFVNSLKDKREILPEGIRQASKPEGFDYIMIG